MKILITAFALAAVLAAPGFLRSAPGASPNDVIMGGQLIGQDPDANVRLELRRGYGSEGY
jgi:hypothetical protein